MKKPLVSHEMRESFKSMVQFGAWKQIEKLMSDLYEQSLSSDSMDINKLSLMSIAEGRGIRRAIAAIRNEVETNLL